MNPLFNMANNNQLLQKFQQFKQNFQGDPKQKVQELLNSGRMTQAQFNKLQSMAQQFRRFLK